MSFITALHMSRSQAAVGASAVHGALQGSKACLDMRPAQTGKHPADPNRHFLPVRMCRVHDGKGDPRA